MSPEYPEEYYSNLTRLVSIASDHDSCIFHRMEALDYLLTLLLEDKPLPPEDEETMIIPTTDERYQELLTKHRELSARLTQAQAALLKVTQQAKTMKQENERLNKLIHDLTPKE